MATRAVLVALLAALLLHVASALAAPQNGWWWNPAESGRGFFVEIQNNFAFIGAYVYAPDGRADWVVSQGTMASPTSYSGRLLSFRGGQTLVSDYTAPGPANDVGAIAIEFTDDRHAVLTWPGGTVSIERLTFDGAPGDPLPKTGWWWNAQESGTGWSIEVQGETIFLVGFMYDDGGNPVWYSSAGRLTSTTSYAGTLLRFTNGQPIAGAYRPPDAPASAGAITIEFTAPDAGEMTLSDGAAVSTQISVKRRRTSPITRTLPPAPIVLPETWQGLFSQIINHTTDGLIFTGRTTVTGEAVVWTKSNPADARSSYVPAGTVQVRSTGTAAGPGLSCTQSGAGTFALSAADAELQVNPVQAVYQLDFHKTMHFPVTQTCTAGDQTFTDTRDAELVLNELHLGNVLDDRIRGHPREILVLFPGETVTTTTHWYFQAVR